jgi:hypothetical protein
MMHSFKVKYYGAFDSYGISDLFHSWGLAETHAFTGPPTDTFVNLDLFHSWGLAETHAFTGPPTDTFVNLDHFDLQGDFSWMYPTPSDELPKMFSSPIFSRNPLIATAEQIDGLVSAASALGVSLPPCFRRFMIDEDLHNRVPYLDRQFTSAPFVKLNLEAHGVGYATEFLNDLETGEAFYLFVGDQGRTGVIRMGHTWEDLRDMYARAREEASYNWPALSALELEFDVIPVSAQLASDTALCALDFEEFLFQLYFHLWVSVATAENLDATPFRPPLEQFLLQICTEESRAQSN